MKARKPFSMIDYVTKQQETIKMFNSKNQARSNELTEKINRAKKQICE